jgi:hypothetical protein
MTQSSRLARIGFFWRCKGAVSCAASLVLGLSAVCYCAGQQKTSQIPVPVTSTENAGSLVSDWTDFGGPYFREKRIQQFNAAQHKALVSDTDRLLKLVSELNAEIGSSNPSALSAEQLRKVAEIEKMSQPVKGLSSYDSQMHTLSPQ